MAVKENIQRSLFCFFCFYKIKKPMRRNVQRLSLLSRKAGFWIIRFSCNLDRHIFLSNIFKTSFECCKDWTATIYVSYTNPAQCSCYVLFKFIHVLEFVECVHLKCAIKVNLIWHLHWYGINQIIIHKKNWRVSNKHKDIYVNIWGQG